MKTMTRNAALVIFAVAQAIAASFAVASPKATHCRIGHEYKADDSIVDLIWSIAPITNLSDLFSGAGQHFEIVDEFFSEAVKDPAMRTSKGDWIYTAATANKDYVNLWHVGDTSSIPLYVSHSTLVREPTHKLWANGHAQLNTTGGARAGEFFLYLREDRPACQHRNAKLNPATGKKYPCRRVLLEYFDDKDTHSLDDRPQLNVNVFAIDSEKCEGTLEETNDGEGDVGPN